MPASSIFLQSKILWLGPLRGAGCIVTSEPYLDLGWTTRKDLV
jgi:hypothetical protein